MANRPPLGYNYDMEAVAAARKRFARLLDFPDEQIDLPRVALAIAEEEYPELDEEPYLRKLDRMGREAASLIDPTGGPLAGVRRLNEYLFKEMGFRGNTEAYYDPRNSYFNDVMDRRTGIPLTLSLVYMEVGRRAGVDVQGVAFPGHFLVKTHVPGGEAIVDPYHRGALLDEEDCKRRWKLATRGRVPFEKRFLRAAGAREIVARMLSNLKSIFLQQGDLVRALGAVERILIAQPDRAGDVRDRGLLYEKLGGHSAAAQELERYLELAGEDADDAEQVKQTLARLRSKKVYLS